MVSVAATPNRAETPDRGVDGGRLAHGAGEPGDDLDEVLGHDCATRSASCRTRATSSRDAQRVVGADLGAEAVLERRDDAPAVGVVLRVGAGHEQQVERQPEPVAAHLDVALLEDVEQRDLDPLGEVGQLVDGEDPAVRPRDQAVVDRLRVAEGAALGHLDRVDVADEVADAGVRRGELLAVAVVAVPATRPASRRRAGRPAAGPTGVTGAYGCSLSSVPSRTGVHSSSRPTRVRIRRVLPWPRSPRSTTSCPASRARSRSGRTVSSKPTMPGNGSSPAREPGEQVGPDLLLDRAVHVARCAQRAQGAGEVGRSVREGLGERIHPTNVRRTRPARIRHPEPQGVGWSRGDVRGRPRGRGRSRARRRARRHRGVPPAQRGRPRPGLRLRQRARA